LDDKTTIAAMLSSMSAYEVQLVLEPMKHWIQMKLNFESYKLKLMYPSITNDYVSPEKDFEKKYRKINNIFLVITLHAALI
jgi:hypothetical protein